MVDPQKTTFHPVGATVCHRTATTGVSVPSSTWTPITTVTQTPVSLLQKLTVGAALEPL